MSDATLSPKPRGRGTWIALGALLAAVALAIGVNVLADRFLSRARLDLTEQRLYTLSEGTRQTVANLRDPITLRLFYSRSLGASVPVFGAYADPVREMLREYVALSNGKIRLEIRAHGQSLVRRCGDPNHAVAGILQQAFEFQGNEDLVLDDQDPEGGRRTHSRLSFVIGSRREEAALTAVHPS